MIKRLKTIAVIAAVMTLLLVPMQSAMAANYVNYNGVKVYYGSNAGQQTQIAASTSYIIGLIIL